MSKPWKIPPRPLLNQTGNITIPIHTKTLQTHRATINKEEGAKLTAQPTNPQYVKQASSAGLPRLPPKTQTIFAPPRPPIIGL